MDDKDIQILKSIADLETNSSGELHKETEIPESTLYYRLNQLKDKSILTNDLYDIDLEKLGFNIMVIVDIIADYDEDYHKVVGDKISAVEGVSHVFFTMGQMDFVAIAQVASRKEVERLISDFEEIDEIRRTQSKFVISKIKEEPRLLRTYSIESLNEILGDGDD
jgi:DNA-binding Lrp family transcriptional regulator